MSKFIFSELKACFANPFSKGIINILNIYLHDLGGCMRLKVLNLATGRFETTKLQFFLCGDLIVKLFIKNMFLKNFGNYYSLKIKKLLSIVHRLRIE